MSVPNTDHPGHEIPPDECNDRSWLERAQPAMFWLIAALGAAFLIMTLLYLAVRN